MRKLTEEIILSNNFTDDVVLYSIQKDEKLESNLKSGLLFEDICKYIESCVAYHDSHCHVFITQNAIYFQHSLIEIEASFPNLLHMIAKRSDKSFSEDNIYVSDLTRYSVTIHHIENPLQTPIKIRQKKLQEEARKYFKHYRVPTPQRNLPSKFSSNLNENFLSLLACCNEGIILGESHSDKFPKKLLIDNMAEIKKSGVEAIFLEHVLHDTQRVMLKDYFESQEFVLPAMLKDYLNHLDKVFHLLSQDQKDPNPYSFTGLVMQAKNMGLKLSPLILKPHMLLGKPIF